MSKPTSVEILSDITVYNKYAKHIAEDNRRESWQEIVRRNMDMHIAAFPQLASQIQEVYDNYVLPKKVLPSMRSLQFGGKPIRRSNNRIFNCAYAPVDHPAIFPEMMFLLLGGTGGGYSVQIQHVSQLPVVTKPKTKRRYIIGDSIEGWADAVKVLVNAFFFDKPLPVFDFEDIREKGAPLITSGGKAPGPAPLKTCLALIEDRLTLAAGRKLRPIEAHDIMCIIADAVLAGGIRRAALISLFSRTDLEMLTCKSGAWWELHPYRGRANNSVVLKRGCVTEQEFKTLWKTVENSKAGEPGVYWTYDEDWGTNPCCEIALKPFQFCNLTEVNVSDVETQDEFNARVASAAFLGTLQAAYTDFHYLRPIWRSTTEEDALIGVSMTGIASGKVLGLGLRDAAISAKIANSYIAPRLGINKASRVCTVKPAGTTSLVVGSSSGIHAWHAKYYIRRQRIGKNEALYKYMVKVAPELVEDDVMVADGAVLSFPQKAPEGAITRDEDVMDLLERVRKVNLEWVREGHREGVNTHNVSCTITIKEDEWEKVGQWMWDNHEDYNGIAVLPFDGGTYPQLPFEEITKEQYEAMLPYLENIDLSQVKETEDTTDLSGEIACSGGACEI